MQIIMTSDILRIGAIKNKTTAFFFKNLKEGDRIRFSTSIPYKDNYNGLFGKSIIMIENLETGEKTTRTPGDLSNRLSCFELVRSGEDNNYDN